MQIASERNLARSLLIAEHSRSRETATSDPVRSISHGNADHAVAAPVETRRPVPPPSGVLDETQVSTSFDPKAEILVVTVATANSGKTVVEIPSAELRALAERTREMLARQAQRED